MDFDPDAEPEDDEEIDSDDAFGEEDYERFKGFSFLGSKKTLAKGADPISKEDDSSEGQGSDEDNMEGIEQEHPKEYGSSSDSDQDLDSADDSGKDEAPSDDSMSDSDDSTAMHDKHSTSIDRDEIRNIMASEQKSVIDNINQAVQADVAKGNAVKQQHSTFNVLLNTRIRLQKGLAITNSLTSQTQTAEATPTNHLAVIEAAESAALDLFNSLTDLRASLPSSSANSKKRPYSATLSDPLESIRSELESVDASFKSRHRTTLDKWARKTRPIASMPAHNKISTTPTTKSLSTVLDSHLLEPNLSRHIKRTQTDRSGVLSNDTPTTSIYDDNDFYALLLRDLVDSKAASSATTNMNTVVTPSAALSGLRKEAKAHRPDVDRKASKGRKMRFTVQEKIQNFMAPEETGSWERRAGEELFASLMGRKINGGLGEGDIVGSDGDYDREAEGLRLFRGA